MSALIALLLSWYTVIFESNAPVEPGQATGKAPIALRPVHHCATDNPSPIYNGI